jgi:hypothetical protein
VDSFFKRLDRLSTKLNDKLVEQTRVLEEQAKIQKEKNAALRERVRLIEEDMKAEEALLQRFNEKLGTSYDRQEEDASTAQDKIIQGYLPWIASAFGDKIGPAVLDIFSDTARLAELARSVYQLMPVPIRLVIKEEVFVEWTISHQDQIVEAIKLQVPLAVPSGLALAPAETDLAAADHDPTKSSLAD